MFEYEGIKIHWLGHDAFWIEAKGKDIYIDPYKLGKSDLPKADIVITTHEHFDHLNPEAINLVSSDKTYLVGPKSCQDKFEKEIEAKKELKELNPGGKIEIEGITLTAIPAYNFKRFRDPETKTPFHPKEQGHIGPILDIDGITIYHAGDADNIEEMNDLQPTIAMIPVSGTYVCDVPDAIEAAKAIKANFTIPMHVGRGIGELSYLEEFKNKLPNMEVVVLELEED
ncbi:MAG: MBL fold metallo-hydrolase [Candidatus Heimdallarchaeaceae archaeon]|jgi:L-ascorbate metabolism protein UlaG (beta-lactamase superfamily)